MNFSEIIGKNREIFFIFGILALFFWNLFLEIRLRREEKRVSFFFKGRKAGDLEEVLLEILKKTRKGEKEIEKILKKLETLDRSALSSIQKVGIVRFNPFKDIGGNQSFSVAFLDQKDDGVVITALHGREGTRVYAKPITNGESSYPLSKEEEEAIRRALSS